jgi:hypothetical protein
MFGGDQLCIGGCGPFDETWEWDGSQWVQVLAPSPASSQAGTAMVYNSSSRAITVLGSSASFGFGTLDKLFTYDGGWIEADNPDHSLVRNTAMVYDEANDLVMTFGGRDENTFESSQTLRAWTPGTGWFDVDQGAEVPPSRLSGATMAYDPVRQRTVLFGGREQFNAALGDVWEWDGGQWLQVDATGPSARFGHVTTYNPDARRVIVFGNAQNAEDMWEWDGVTWTQRPIDPSVPLAPRYKTSVAYDAARHHFFTFGGRDSNFGVSGGIQLLQYRAGADVEACTYANVDYDNDGLAGCADTDDCWSVCTPLCPPGTSCPAGSPRCGDGQCAEFEDCNMCPGDCGVCPGTCGDFSCGAGESVASCPNDC